MLPEEYAQFIGALKAIGGLGGLALVVGVLWKQFLGDAAQNRKKVAQATETRITVVENRVQGMSDAYRAELSQLGKEIAVLQDRSARGSVITGGEGPTVMNYPNPMTRRRTRELPAAKPAEEEEDE